MNAVLVTGAGGFVGANLARRLVADGNEVHAVVRPGSDAWRLTTAPSSIAVHGIDLTDRRSVEALIGEVAPVRVFHLAAYGAYPAQTDPHQMVNVNVVGTANLVESAMAEGVEAFVAAGSSSEYGLKDHAPTEDEILEPNSYYAVTKGAATMYCRFVGRSSGAPITVLRLNSVYGPWEEPTRLMPILVRAAQEGRLPPLASPATARDWVYVADVIDAFLLAAEHAAAAPGAIYNIGTGVQTSLAELVGMVRAVLDVAEEPNWESYPARSWDTSTWVAAPGRARRNLGWHPAVSLRDGLASFARWLSDPAVAEQYRSREPA